MHLETREDLMCAMREEAFAYLKYLAFAEHARRSGMAFLADRFERLAYVARYEHFEKEARLAGLVAGDAENLRDAIAGETYASQTLYQANGERAAARGDLAAAACFAEMQNDENKHLDALNAALRQLQMIEGGSRGDVDHPPRDDGRAMSRSATAPAAAGT